MDQNTLLLVVVDGLSLISGLGGIILVVLAAKRPRQRVIASALCGGLTGLLIVAAPSELGSALSSVLGLGGGALAGIAMAYLVDLALSARSGRLAFMSALRGWLERTLLPSRWAIAADKPPITARDLAKRCFVTIAATTGGVVGSLLEMNSLWDALIHALAPQRLFATLVVTTVSVALIGPLHEYVLDRGMQSRGPDPIPFGHALTAMWEHMSWRAAGRLGLVFLALVQVEAIYGSVHDSMSKGN